MEEEKQTIHVLMVAFASQGHINPMLRLAKLLQTKRDNIHVTLATTEVLRHRILVQDHQSAATTATNQLPSISGIDFEFFSDGFSMDYDRKSNLDTYMDNLAKHGPINLYNLIISLASHEQTKPKKFSCIINNPFVPWVVDVAARLEIPCAMLWIQPCTLFVIYHSFNKNASDFPTKENPDMSVNLPSVPLLKSCDLPTFLLPSNPLGSIPKTLLEAIKNAHKVRWIMANSFYELERDVINSMSKFVNMKAVGPLVPATLLGEECHQGNDQLGINMWKPDDNCIVWLNKNEPKSVIYVSFGSLIVLSSEKMEMIATALKESKRRFLWVVKKQDYNQDSKSEGQLPEGFLEDTKEQGIVVPWCPQDMVLSHESIGCFITHCGWNSMLETLSVGVPIIAYPMWSDQPTNAKLMSDVFKVGLRVWANKDGLIESNAIKKCIEEIMDGPKADEIRAKAEEWKRMARDAVGIGGSSDRIIQEFVDDMVEKSSRVNYDAQIIVNYDMILQS